MRKRDIAIDILRVIGILFVIASHCGYSGIMNELFCFDVVMLVFTTGLSFMVSSFTLEKDSYSGYVYKRFMKLIVPTWIFVSVVLIVLKFVFHETLSAQFILKSYLLLAGGLNFVWVYRVFFTSSLISPFFKKTIQEMNPWLLLCIFLCVMVSNDLLHSFVFSTIGLIGKIMEYVVTYTIGYLMITCIGMLSVRFEDYKKLMVGGLFVLIAILSKQITGEMWTTFKYPPYLMYCSYGLALSFICYFFLSKVHFGEALSKCVIWFSKNARSIYLWHGLFFYICKYAKINLPPTAFLVLLVSVSVLCSYIEYKVLRIWRRQKENG